MHKTKYQKENKLYTTNNVIHRHASMRPLSALIDRYAACNPPAPYGGRKNHYVDLIPYTLHYNVT